MTFSLGLGNYIISHVHEQTKPFVPATDFFSGITPQRLAQACAELGPSHIAPDGRIILSMHSFVVRTGRYNVLIDTCCGDDKDRPTRPEFHQKQTGYLQELAKAGLHPENIDFVMCTHLHWDHVGWNTRLIDGRWVPTFPNAQYIISQKEYEYWNEACRQGVTNNNTLAFKDSVAPIIREGKALLVEYDYELDHGVSLEPCPGHTPGNYVINVKSRDEHGVVAGDVIHHQLQLLFPDILCNVDGDIQLGHESRMRLINRYAGTRTLLLPAHFPGYPFGRIEERKDGGFCFAPVESSQQANVSTAA